MTTNGPAPIGPRPERKNRGAYYSDSGCGYDETAPAFVAGAAYGLRSFAVGMDGRLRGVTYPQAWEPGENVARCYVAAPTSLARGPWRRDEMDARVIGGWLFSESGEISIVPGWKTRECGGIEPGCACGFYAYHDNRERGYSSNPRYAVGIIRAYGRVVVGPYGYRAEKATIVALVLPDEDKIAETNRAEIDRLTRAVARMEERYRSVLSLAGRMSSSIVGFLAWRAQADSSRRFLFFARKRLDEFVAATERRPTNTGDRIRAHYPDVALFPDIASMRAAFPIESLAHLVETPPEAES